MTTDDWRVVGFIACVFMAGFGCGMFVEASRRLRYMRRRDRVLSFEGDGRVSVDVDALVKSEKFKADIEAARSISIPQRWEPRLGSVPQRWLVD